MANSTEVEAFFPQLISFCCNFLNFFEGSLVHISKNLLNDLVNFVRICAEGKTS